MAGVIIEAVNGSVKFYHDLTGRGCDVKLVPSVVVDQMRIGQRDKTDRRDAQLLANYGAQLHMGLSAEQIWAPDKEIVSLRQLTRTRNKLVSQRTALINVLHGLLQAWGVVIQKGQLNSQANLQLVRHLGLPAEAHPAAVAPVATLEKLNELIKQMNRKLRDIARQHSGVKLGRFASKAKLRAYAGVVPTLRQSSSFCRHGSLRRAWNRHLKRALGQAANIISRLWATGGELTKYWWRVFARYQTATVADVALARKLVAVVWGLWRDQVACVEAV